MVKITHLPYQEVIIHEIIEQDNDIFFEDIVRQVLASQLEPSVNWIEGIAFQAFPFPPTEDIVRESLAGKIHFSSVIFTRIAYQDRVPVKIGNQEYSARLRNNAKNKIHVELTRFLKDFKPSLGS